MVEAFVTREHAFRAAQSAARNQGYAVAKHGSEIRDLDLVAIPWRETAINALRIAEIIAHAIPGVLLDEGQEKPYGRVAFEIHPLKSAGHRWGHGFDHWYVDLSVMPRCEASSRGQFVGGIDRESYDERRNNPEVQARISEASSRGQNEVSLS